MHSWLVIVDMRRTKFTRVMSKSKLNLGLNIPKKLNKMLIDSFVVFFLLHGPFEASFYEITVLPEDIKRMEWNGMVWSGGLAYP